MNVQRVAAIVRQVVAIAALIIGPLTAAVSSMKLPPAVSAVITSAGVIILAIEHFVSDPTTGIGTPSTPSTSPTPPAPHG